MFLEQYISIWQVQMQKKLILEENFKWYLEAFASELFTLNGFWRIMWH